VRKCGGPPLWLGRGHHCIVAAVGLGSAERASLGQGPCQLLLSILLGAPTTAHRVGCLACRVHQSGYMRGSLLSIACVECYLANDHLTLPFLLPPPPCALHLSLCRSMMAPRPLALCPPTPYSRRSRWVLLVAAGPAVTVGQAIEPLSQKLTAAGVMQGRAGAFDDA
jgi:hypothetical protein